MWVREGHSRFGDHVPWPWTTHAMSTDVPILSTMAVRVISPIFGDRCKTLVGDLWGSDPSGVSCRFEPSDLGVIGSTSPASLVRVNRRMVDARVVAVVPSWVDCDA